MTQVIVNEADEADGVVDLVDPEPLADHCDGAGDPLGRQRSSGRPRHALRAAVQNFRGDRPSHFESGGLGPAEPARLRARIPATARSLRRETEPG